MPFGVGNPVVLGPKSRGMSASSFGGGPTSPEQVTGLIGWYDFSDITTLWKDTARTSAVTADADVILGVTDKSGTDHHLSEATNGPVYKENIKNGLSIGRFATNTLLKSTAIGSNTTACTVLVVLDLAAASPGYGNGTFSRFDGAAYQTPRGATEGGPGWRVEGMSDGNLVGAFTGSPWQVVSVWLETGDAAIRIDGVTKATKAGTLVTPFSTTNSLAIGRRDDSFLSGDMGEFLFFSRRISVGEAVGMEDYLMAKWGFA